MKEGAVGYGALKDPFAPWKDAAGLQSVAQRVVHHRRHHVPKSNQYRDHGMDEECVSSRKRRLEEVDSQQHEKGHRGKCSGRPARPQAVAAPPNPCSSKDEKLAELAVQLREAGAVTIPVCSLQEVVLLHTKMHEVCKSFPEFLPQARRYVLGSFGALGNPASFHHPLLRKLRLRCFRRALPLFREYLLATGESDSHTHLEMLLDRLCWRLAKDRIRGETAHRDKAVHACPGDEVFGGWLNLDARSQYFHCASGSHNDAQNAKLGFCKEVPPGTASIEPIEVPPGHLVVFYQQILHEVHKHTVLEHSLRLFVGWRLTSSSLSLQDRAAMKRREVADLQTVLQRQAVPLLPSGQMPPMYAQAHRLYSQNFGKLLEFSSHIADCCKEWVERQGDKHHLVLRFLPGLADLGLPLYPQYTDEECSILRPATAWTLSGTFVSLHDPKSDLSCESHPFTGIS